MTKKITHTKSSISKGTLYFAYGSNLDRAQMRRRCPESKFYRRATLKDHRLKFMGSSVKWSGGVASVEKSSLHDVEGLIYRVSDKDLERLDRFEGHPTVYKRVFIPLELEKPKKNGNRIVSAWVYIKNHGQESTPSEKYFRKIVQAYLKNGFDLEPLFLSHLQSEDS